VFGFGAKRSGIARSPAADLYIELLERSVSNSLYGDDLELSDEARRPMDEKVKYLGQGWPSRAHTMIGAPRLRNLRACIEAVLEDGVAGDFIETGVWRGGACIFMRGILKAYGVEDRTVWAADSFAGLPQADLANYPRESSKAFHEFSALAVSLEDVQRNFARYGLLDGQVKFLKGWFRDTLPGAPIRTLAILRLDGDMYETTMDALQLYPKLSPGGFVIVDDYNNVKACNDATEDCRKERGVTEPLQLIEGGGAFWRKR
jgi:hypothetical protein